MSINKSAKAPNRRVLISKGVLKESSTFTKTSRNSHEYYISKGVLKGTTTFTKTSKKERSIYNIGFYRGIMI